jgi:hypothetical protein
MGGQSQMPLLSYEPQTMRPFNQIQRENAFLQSFSSVNDFPVRTTKDYFDSMFL